MTQLIDQIFYAVFYLGSAVLAVGAAYLTYSYFKIQHEIRQLERKHEQDQSLGI